MINPNPAVYHLNLLCIVKMINVLWTKSKSLILQKLSPSQWL